MADNTKEKDMTTENLSLFHKLRYIFDRRQKKQFVILGIMILIGGLFETLGVSMIVPVVTAIIDPDTLHKVIDKASTKIPFIKGLLDAFGLDSDKKLIIFLLLTLIFIFVIKNIYLLILTARQNAFVAYGRNEMISRVMREFLNRPYEYYLGADIPTVFRITDSDIPNLFNMVMAILSLATELVVSSFLAIVLIFVNWQMTLFIVAVFLVITILNTKILKPRMEKYGAANQKVQSRIAKWRLQAIYGLKDVKVLHREDFFIRNYYDRALQGVAEEILFCSFDIDHICRQ